ncbi:MAG TPA: Gfo/Idh/MocA family oxidoreductase, partial [Candidatus Aquilonibacter sp.]|nr:Gfo/Idh/MocA family oxidoreductase [Candidatus Aquilonibacter sp.]
MPRRRAQAPRLRSASPEFCVEHAERGVVARASRAGARRVETEAADSSSPDACRGRAMIFFLAGRGRGPHMGATENQEKGQARPLNAAVVGYGFAGQTFHAPVIAATPGIRLSHIVSSDAAKVHRDFPDVGVLRTTEEACADPTIDLIVVATPNTTHYELAHMALGAGKHVVVDKPFTLNVADAEKLLAQAA